MKIITLTSDLGLNDHYVAAIKGTLLSLDSEVQIIDISHSVKPFDTGQAAFLLNSTYKDFPKGTVHLVAIDSEPQIGAQLGQEIFPSIMEYDGHYFVSTDNGFFGAFLQENHFDKFWRIDDVLSRPNKIQFAEKNILAPIAVRVASGENIDSFATSFDRVRKAFFSAPLTEVHEIKGSVVYIDSFGNAITNITRELFDRIGKKDPFRLLLKRSKHVIDQLSTTYSDVSAGERVAFFNEQNLLEIAINRGANAGYGGAEKLLGIMKDDKIIVKFEPQGSRETLHELF